MVGSVPAQLQGEVECFPSHSPKLTRKHSALPSHVTVTDTGVWMYHSGKGKGYTIKILG